MNDNECSGMTGDLWNAMKSDKIDEFSSAKVFEKVKHGLEGALGQPILLVNPESAGGYRGWDIAEDYTSRVSSFGFLNGVPSVSRLDKDLLMNISLPVDKYVHGLSKIKDGPMVFNCISAEGIGISDSKILNNKINLYVGTRMIEEFMDRNVEGYFKGMNRLGGKVSDEFYSMYGERLEEGKEQFLLGLGKDIARDLSDDNCMNKEKWQEAYDSILGWKVGDDILELGSMIHVPIKSYVESKL